MKIIALLLSFIGVAMLVLSFTKVVVETSVKKKFNTVISLKTDGLIARPQVNTTATGKWKMVNGERYKPVAGAGSKHNYVSKANDGARADETGLLLITGNSNGYKATSSTYSVTSVPQHCAIDRDLRKYSDDQQLLLAELPVTAENRLALTAVAEATVYAFN